MTEQYIVKPLGITQDPRLSFAEQDYLCLIWQLHNANGCTASNGWFSEYFGTTRQRSSVIIGSLARKKIIAVQLEREGKLIVRRTIKIIDKGVNDILTGYQQNVDRGCQRFDKEGVNEIAKGKVKEKVKQTISADDAKEIFDNVRKLYPGRKGGLDVEFSAFKKSVKDWKDVLPILEKSIRAYTAHCEYLQATGQFCPHHKDFCRWLKNRCWETEYPDPMAGVTREADPDEIEKLLGGTA